MADLHYISVNEIYPHPDNPRKDLGDLTELAASIKANGIFQNLTVVPNMVTGEITGETWQRGYTVIIGHRRLAAAKLAGLTEVPCVVSSMDAKEQIRTMLLENMQRSDLTVYEQAQGFQMMMDLGDTVEEIAEKSGFSQSTVRRRVKLLDLDKDKFKASVDRGATLMDYAELDKIEDSERKNKVLEAIGTANFKEALKKAIEEETLEKLRNQWKTDLEAFALKIEKTGYVGETPVDMVYVRGFSRWTKDAIVERPEDADTVKYYYTEHGGDITLYKDRPAPEEHEETEEERQRREMREAAEEKGEALKEIAKRHFELRSEFVENFAKAKKYSKEISAYAAAFIVKRCAQYSYATMDVALFSRLLAIEVEDEMSTVKLVALTKERAAAVPEYALLVGVYVNSDSKNKGYFDRQWNSGEQIWGFPHAPNSDLDDLYAFLVSLGYEMSDEEKAMQNGTHELFNTKEEEENSHDNENQA